MDKILVTGENREYYTDLVPADIMHMMYEPGYTTVGGYETGDKTDVPVAVMIASKNGENLVINWLYVAEEKRNLGYGGDLVDYAFTLARENSLKNVTTMVRRTEVHNQPGDPIDYFMELGFRIAGQTENEWLVTAPLYHDIMMAPVNLDEIEEKAYEHWLESEKKRLEDLAAIPEVAKVVDIEYFSGIVTET